MVTHSSILAWRIPWTEEPVGYSPWGHQESDTFTFTFTGHDLPLCLGLSFPLLSVYVSQAVSQLTPCFSKHCLLT